MVALGFMLFLRLPCRDHSIFREVSEALDAGTLHADMQDPWFSQGFQRVLLNYVRVHAGTVADGGRHAAPLGDAGFPLVLQGILIDSLVPHWGMLEQDHFLGGAS